MVINKHAVYKELIARYGSDCTHTYLKVSEAIDGDFEFQRLTKEEKKQIIEIIDEAAKEAKANILKS